MTDATAGQPARGGTAASVVRTAHWRAVRSVEEVVGEGGEGSVKD